MPRSFRPHFDSILHDLNSWTVSNFSTALALEFAILGQLGIATALLSLQAQHDHLYLFAENRYVFTLAWHITKTWPSFLSTEQREQWSKDVEDEKRAGAFPHWPLIDRIERWQIPTAERTEDEVGLQRCLEVAEKADSDAVGGTASKDRSDALVKALDICLKTGDEEQARKILSRCSRRLVANRQIVTLGQCARAWESGLLTEGAVAKELGIDEERLQKLGNALLATFKERYENGAEPIERPLASKSWEEVLQMADEGTQKNAQPFLKAHGFVDGKLPGTGSLLQPPATEEQINHLEQRLGVELPKDYKAFLHTSDGLGAGTSGPVRWYYAPSRFLGLLNDIPRVVFEATDMATDEEKAAVQQRFGGPMPLKTFQAVIRDISAQGYGRFGIFTPSTTDCMSPFARISDVNWVNVGESNSLIDDVSLALMPWTAPGGACLREVEWPPLRRALLVSEWGRESVLLVDPSSVAAARNAFWAAHAKADEAGKRDMDEQVVTYFGSSEKFEALQWLTLDLRADGRDPEVWSGFREYLEDLATLAAESRERPTDESGVLVMAQSRLVYQVKGREEWEVFDVE